MNNSTEKLIYTNKNDSVEVSEFTNKFTLENNLETYKNINKTLNSFSEDFGYLIYGNVRTLANWKSSKKMRRIPIMGFVISMFQFLFLRLLPKTWGF